jgi:putative copper resistance protein D
MSGFADSTRDWLIVVRAIHFVATATIAGTLIFRMMVAQPALRLARAAAPIFDARILRVAWISLVISMGSGIAWVLLQAPAMSGLSFGEAMNADTIGTVLTETQFGLVSEIRFALAIVLAACLAFDRPPVARWLALASAIGFVAAVAWTGHAGSTAGELGFFHLASDALHLVAAAAWIGGLISLAVFLAVVRRHPAYGWAAVVYDVAQRFSTLGIVSVATLLVTGVVNASILVGSLHALLVTTYGRLLMLKIALFAIMLGFAAFNRIWLTPRFAGIGREERKIDAVPKFARNCIVEIALGLAIFGIVGALGTLHPAKHLMSRIRSSPHLALPSPATFGFLDSHNSGLFEPRSLLAVTQPRLCTLGMIVEVAERMG